MMVKTAAVVRRFVVATATLSLCSAGIGCQDAAGSAAVLVTDAHGIRSMTVSENHVYWSTNFSGQIKRVSIDGGESELLVSESQQHPEHLTVDREYVYWITADNNVKRVLHNGGEPELLVNTSDDLTGLAVDESHIYFSVQSGELGFIAKDDIEPNSPSQLPNFTTLQTGAAKPGPLVVAGSLFMLDRGASTNDGQVLRFDSTDSVPGAVTTPLKAPTSVGASLNAAMWTSTVGDTVGWSSLNDSNAYSYEGGHLGVFAVVGDNDNAYWTSLDGTLTMAPIDGGPSQDIGRGPAANVHLAMDATSIYWANSEAGTIVMRLKPSSTVYE